MMFYKLLRSILEPNRTVKSSSHFLAENKATMLQSTHLKLSCSSVTLVLNGLVQSAELKASVTIFHMKKNF